MKKPIVLLATLLFSVAANSQSSESGSSDSDQYLGPGKVATVNGQRIPVSIFRLYTLGVLQADPDTLTSEARTQVINRLVYMLLLAQEAESKGLEKERRIAAELEFQRIQTLASFMSDRYAQENPPTSDEVSAFYDENLPLLQRTEYKARHIIVESQAKAKDIIEELDDGGDFVKLAKKYSTGSEADNGGDLGWLSIDSVDEPFAAALTATTPGKHYPEPVQTEYGWHVIKVDEVRHPDPPSMESIRDQLISAINSQKLAEHVDSLLKSAEVEIED